MNIIDPHIHLFDFNKGEYHWLKPENLPHWPDKQRIVRDFNESDLTLDSGLKLAGFVHIEAGFNNNQPWKEIEWLESHCTKPFKSVAAIDLTLPMSDFNYQITKLCSLKTITGCRHILDDDYLNVLQHPNTLTNIQTLANHQLHFELQMPIANSQAVDLFQNILNNVPTLKVIINHSGWPCFSINDENYDQWLHGLKQFSLHEHCSIKCSGLEMTNRDYTLDNLTFTLQTCVNIFGIKRVMIASNFPLCLFSHSYQNFWQLNTSALQLNSQFSNEQLDLLCYQNAKRFYNL